MADPVKPEASAGAGGGAAAPPQRAHQGPKYSAPKDKNCPFCGQAFTSSSLGRHLDLYIKPRNPKAPDNIHDVDEIRKLRGNITRRQARGSLPARGGSVSPATDASNTGTPAATTPQPGCLPSTRRETMREGDSPSVASAAAAPAAGIGLLPFSLDAATAAKYPYTPKWDGTSATSQDEGQDHHPLAAGAAAARKRPGVGSRTVSKQAAAKAQFEAKTKVTDAMDTARAAELALRELLGSWRAAKEHLDLNSMPFVDCSPLTLDFPALTLQYLHQPPTLFASTLTPSAGAWSTIPPGQREFISLQAFFKEKFSKWKAACLRSTRANLEELAHHPSWRQDGSGSGSAAAAAAVADTHEAVRLAEEQADAMEKQVLEHVNEAYSAWIQRGLPDRAEIWVLELARGIGKARKDIERLKEEKHRLAQENANLKTQIDNLNRLQQPREFKMQTPGTLALGRELVSQVLESGLLGDGGAALAAEERHMDLNTAVAKMIERWKPVVAAARAASSGMTAQRPLAEQIRIQTQTQHQQQRHQVQTQQQQQQAPEVVMINTPVTMAGSGCPTPSRSRSHPQPPTPADNSSAANTMPTAGPSDAQTTPPSVATRGASPIDDASDVEGEEEDEEADGRREINRHGAVEVSGDPSSVDTSMDGDGYPVMHQAPPATMSPVKQTLGSNVPPSQQQPVEMDLSSQHNHNLGHVHHNHSHSHSHNHNSHHNNHSHAHNQLNQHSQLDQHQLDQHQLDQHQLDQHQHNQHQLDQHQHQHNQHHQMQQQIQQMQSQMQAHVSSVAAVMQRSPDLGIPMEATQLFMANQKAAQAAHMSNMARSMPAMAAALQTPLHSAAGMGLPIQDAEGMYME